MSRIDLVALAHQAIAERLHEGDIAIDATIGNGHDTLFLAHHVGLSGHLYGFDIQHRAITTAQQRLEQAGIAARATLVERGHEKMVALIPKQHHGRIQAVMFNLGYLPGADKSVITSAATTRRALTAACALLAPGGVITVLAYTGHPGGRHEADTIKTWANQLDQHLYSLAIHIPAACSSSPPELIIIKDQRSSQV